MKKITIVILLLSVFATAGPNPNPAQYTVKVHVSTSHMVVEGTSIARRQKLNVVIDGKKFELESEISPNALLALGDYKAKLVKDEHRGGYDSDQVYELIFPDGKARQFRVIGQSE